MDLRGARKFRVSNRALVPIIAVCALLLVSAIWNLALYRRAEEQRSRAIAAERAAATRAEEQRLRAVAMEREEAARAQAEAERERILAKKRAARAEDAARVRQLYQELNVLSQMNDRILLQNQSLRIPAKKGERPDQAGK
jgi:regulator of protease activity HflC (stomatin/prohibitin superfamily)